MLQRNQMHPYQNRVVAVGLELSDKGGCYIAEDCGLGKTVSALTLILDLMVLGRTKNTLVVAPPRVAKDVWLQELQGWDHLRHMTMAVLTGTPTQRSDILNGELPQIVVISYNLLEWMYKFYEGKEFPFDTVICDEASALKTHNSKRVKIMKKIRKKVERVYMMSATPSADTLLSLWPQYFLIDGGKRLGKSFRIFKQRYFYPTDYMEYTWEPKDGSVKRITEAISDITLRLSAEDYLDLPPLIHNTIRVTQNPNAKKVYKELERDFFLELNSTPITAVNAAVLSGKLRQCANGFVYDEDGFSHIITDAKLYALGELIEGDDKPLLVFYEFKSDWERIKERFPTVEHIKDEGVVDRWNNPEVKLPVLCGHYGSMAHGLNLQKGGATRMCFFSPTWSNEQFQQAVGRLYRQGVSGTVTAHHLVTTDTIDEKVVRALVHKQDVQKSLLEGLT